MYRSIVVCLALCCLPACLPPPGAPSVPQIDVTGQWTGTYESSWGTLPVTFTLALQKNSTSLTGSYVIDRTRATGTIGGVLHTREKDSPADYYGTMTIAYVTPAGETCHGTTTTTVGTAYERSAQFVTSGIVSGNCPDPPSAIRITLRR